MAVVGTRPEGIKVAPVIRALRASTSFDCTLVSTGQHGAMLSQVFEHFGLTPDAVLDVSEGERSLAEVTASCIRDVDGMLSDARPDVVLVQGDTASALGAAVAAFLRGIPVVHLEAGLRTGDLSAPHPEEGNRRAIGQLADLHLAPTARCRLNLAKEGVDASAIVTTGNTAIDAVLWTAAGLGQRPSADPKRPKLLVTAHRRESWGRGISDIASAVSELASRHPNAEIIIPAHPNPAVRDTFAAATSSRPNVDVLGPLRYEELVALLLTATIVLTDSGGLQEEAPALNVPVLVLRDATERQEGVEAGCSALVGTDPATIVERASDLLDDDAARRRMAQAPNPYGDGNASERVVDALLWRFGTGARPTEFGAGPVPGNE